MKWVSKDIETYSTAKEYVDTAVIPIYSVSFGNEMKQSASNAEFITLLTTYLERQFTGRLLLVPPFTYLKSDNQEDILQQLKKWEENIETSEFKHIFYITTEIDWKNFEKELTGSLIWLPSLPLEHLNDSQKISMVESQVKQLLSLFTQKWHENL
ncbi:YpiF family protein [Neobacillus niacini]|uniref:YpiF family protein n=1 Tax=Neobacillus niacini TaxID=86668 RepID=UPI001C8EE4D4|nr:YpiF family protein [Neobacillus niacini]MBY0145464.1 YpiF family protein [Neobacillus niacini]